ncbi:hypothetical protein LOTGIDRAFT_174667 [Lottia gigantea]|uniref:Uncharacterized protein n=1 Tax=Lottia gigantea TaxID=225164 RepID=V4ATJ0_LOTGI|nr:hypothetical protein LOTGIDRAFT_174667 [Lottia gigantea]ESO97061.1 hypothetical protein LOTGIDRAFT_174667 [Lottia gigantea]
MYPYYVFQTGRCVPLLIPPEVKRAMEFLSNSTVREKGGIKKTNTFMFANTGDAVVRAGDSLNEIKGRLKLKQPSRILATNLRKHTATISQVVSLDEQQMKNVCNHLGHSQRVHDEYYRQTSGLIERIDIAKLMLMQEHNLVGKYANKKLSEIQFDDILEDIDISNPDNGNPEKNHDIVQEEATEEFVDLLDEQRRMKRKVKRVRWDNDEIAEIKRYFDKYFNGRSGKTCPSQDECKSAVKKSEKNNGEIWKRGWENIKKKVNNMLKK